MDCKDELIKRINDSIFSYLKYLIKYDLKVQLN